MNSISTNVVWHTGAVTRRQREEQNGHAGCVLWFTGLSGSGKSTLANAVEAALHRNACRTFVLDGDNVRHGLCGDLGFSDDDRRENIRRVGETARLFVDGGVIALAAFISPFRADRERVRSLIGDADFLEIHCHCPLDVCEERDVKGLYKKARQGLIRDFTGISSPYETPDYPDLSINTAETKLDDSVAQVMALLAGRGKFPAAEELPASRTSVPAPKTGFSVSLRHGVAAALTCMLLALFAGGAFAAPADVKPLQSLKSDWKLAPQYSDEFDGAALDSAKWDNDVADWGVWSWEPQNAWVEAGNLNLRMQYAEHKRGWQTLYFKSGAIKSKAAPIRYGYFEARIKGAARFPGVAPAFWVYRDDGTEWTEIDFVELTQRRLDPRIIDTNLLVHKLPSFPHALPLIEERSWHAPWDPRDDFHVYGCEWDSKEIRWYVDGILIQARRNEYWHQPVDVLVSFGVRGDQKTAPSSAGFPTQFLTDYVRVWTSN